jgi:Spy/CpxP family protein refolding chaperone
MASAGLNAFLAGQRMTSTEPCGAGRLCPITGTRPACPLADELQLTEEQRVKIFDCCGGGVCRRQREQQAKALDDLIVQLERALEAQTVDSQLVRKLADEIASLRAQEWKDRIQCVLQVRSALTPEQLARLTVQRENP